MAAYTMFDLSGAALYNVSSSALTLSLQDAFGLYPNYSQYIGVFPEACNVAGPQNCTASCLNASMMFGDLEIFHNCLVYPAVADLYVNGSLGDPHLADSLGILNQSQPMQTANNITTTIYTCLSSYCREDKQCTSDLQRFNAFYYRNKTEYDTDYASEDIYWRSYLTVPTIFEFDICKYAAPDSFLNADIGGVGVGTNPIKV